MNVERYYRVCRAILLDFLSRQESKRIPEPDLIMTEKDSVDGYVSASRSETPLASVHLFQSALVSRTINGCRKVLDLACGPATFLARVAELHPEIQFTGVDLSENMIQSAKAYVAQRGITNVDFVHADITALPFAERSVDGVISTVALHHLPTLEDLGRCFRDIHRVLRPEGAIALFDFARLKSPEAIDFLVGLSSDSGSEVFQKDYENSLKAAFLRREVEQLVKSEFASRQVKVFCTMPFRFMLSIMTPPKGLSKERMAKLQAERAALSPLQRQTLRDLGLLFRFGGISGNPF